MKKYTVRRYSPLWWTKESLTLLLALGFILLIGADSEELFFRIFGF